MLEMVQDRDTVTTSH